MREEKVLITGCGGMLGNAVYPFFLSRYKHVLATDKDARLNWLSPLDVRDKAHLAETFASFKPDLVLHLAAETNLEYCEMHQDITMETNQHATATVAKFAEEHGATLVYISTAGVFDGKKDGAYTEEDTPNPIMVYGRTKYEGELAALQNCRKTFVVRAGWMMGGGRHNEKKFIYEILKQLQEGRQVIHAVNDRWGAPTYTYDFAKNLFRLLETANYGTYHMVCEGFGSRFDVAREILNICNRGDVRVEPVGSDYFKERYFAPRPVSEVMRNAALEKFNCNLMRNWKTSLDDYIRTFFADYIAGGQEPSVDRREFARESVHLPLLFVRRCDSENKDELLSAIITDRGPSGIGIVTEEVLCAGQKILFSPTRQSNNFISAVVTWAEHVRGRTRAGLTMENSQPPESKS